MVGQLLDLRSRDSWDPAELLEVSFTWPTDGSQVRLAELVEVLRPTSTAAAGTVVLTPANVDMVTGDARRRSSRYSGPVFQVRRRGTGLRPGDLLVPPAAGTPAVLVTDELVGASIASSFTAVRPLAVDGVWLWAVLNSRSGQTARSVLQTSGVLRTVPRRRLLEMSVPVPPLAQQHDAELAAVADAVSLAAEEQQQSWWRVTTLPASGEWKAHLVTPHPEWLTDGTPLSDICAAIAGGRHAREAIRTAVPGWSPVTDPGVLAGRPPRRWLPPTARVVTATPGDVMVSGIGPSFAAQVAGTTQVVGPEVYVLRLHDPRQAPALAHYLNSGPALTRRALLITGSVLPRLTPADLRRFPVPPDALAAPVPAPASPPRPLADRLEELLWP